MSSKNCLIEFTPADILYKNTACLEPLTSTTPPESLSPVEEALVSLIASLTVAQVIAEISQT